MINTYHKFLWVITQLFPRTKKYYFQLNDSNSLIYRELYNYFILEFT
nr:MAG TPA: hypothetical protein [Caudoviricetes sp.]